MIEIVLDAQLLGYVVSALPVVFIVLVLATPISAVTNIEYITAVIIGFLTAGVVVLVIFVIVSLFMPTPLGIQIINFSVDGV
jgi:FtsH-binding integral membrane protein